jgi:hypothetical protein
MLQHAEVNLGGLGSNSDSAQIAADCLRLLEQAGLSLVRAVRVGGLRAAGTTGGRFGQAGTKLVRLDPGPGRGEFGVPYIPRLGSEPGARLYSAVASRGLLRDRSHGTCLG